MDHNSTPHQGCDGDVCGSLSAIDFLVSDAHQVSRADVSSYTQPMLVDLTEQIRAIVTHFGAFSIPLTAVFSSFHYTETPSDAISSDPPPSVSLGHHLLDTFSLILSYAMPADAAAVAALFALFSISPPHHLSSPPSSSTPPSAPSFSSTLTRLVGPTVERHAYLLHRLLCAGHSPALLPRLSLPDWRSLLPSCDPHLASLPPLDFIDVDLLRAVDVARCADLHAKLPLAPPLPPGIAAAHLRMQNEALLFFASRPLLVQQQPAPDARIDLRLLVFGDGLPPDGLPMDLPFNALLSEQVHQHIQQLALSSPASSAHPDAQKCSLLAHIDALLLSFDESEAEAIEKEKEKEEDPSPASPEIPFGFVLLGEPAYGMSLCPLHLLYNYYGLRCLSIDASPCAYPLRLSFHRTLPSPPLPRFPPPLPLSSLARHHPGRPAASLRLVQHLHRFGWATLCVSAEETAVVQRAYDCLLSIFSGQRAGESAPERRFPERRFGSRAIGCMGDGGRRWIQTRPGCDALLGWSEEALHEARPLLESTALLHRTAEEALGAVAEVLGLRVEGILDTADCISPSVHRMLFYEPQDAAYGSSPHCDMGILTVSPASTRPALGVHHARSLRLLQPEEHVEANHWLVFAGETLSFLTSGRIAAPVHFVPPTPAMPDSPPRRSMPFFLRSAPEALLTPLDPSVDPISTQTFLRRHAAFLRPWRLGALGDH